MSGETAPTPPTALERLRSAKGFVFDMDGVLYLGNQPLPGVIELLDALAVRGRGIMLATNNSMSTPASYVKKLETMGITLPAESILTSGLATRDYLERTLPAGSSILVVGMPALKEQLFTESSFQNLDYGGGQPDAVVVALDRAFDYAKLSAASAAVRAGARFIATNADGTLPTEHGLIPGAGSVVAAIRAASGVEPVVIGKPETPLLEMAAARLGLAPVDAVMVGDRLDTDITAGHRAGMLTVLVLTGVSTREELATAPVRPDIVVNDLPSLTAALIAG